MKRTWAFILIVCILTAFFPFAVAISPEDDVVSDVCSSGTLIVDIEPDDAEMPEIPAVPAAIGVTCFVFFRGVDVFGDFLKAVPEDAEFPYVYPSDPFAEYDFSDDSLRVDHITHYGKDPETGDDIIVITWKNGTDSQVAMPRRDSGQPGIEISVEYWHDCAGDSCALDCHHKCLHDLKPLVLGNILQTYREKYGDIFDIDALPVTIKYDFSPAPPCHHT